LDNPLFMGMGLSASAGLNAYIPLLALGLADRASESIDLGRPYDFLSSTGVLILILALLSVELVLDKIPRVDHFSDLVHLAIRPGAGALVFMASVEGEGVMHSAVAMLFGLAIAAAVHWYKMLQRPAITLQTAGLGNPLVSIVEDGIATLTSLVSVLLPLAGAVLVLPGAAMLHASYAWVRTAIRPKV
jgi:hypothetical protein